MIHPSTRTFCPLASSPSRHTAALMSQFHPAQGTKHLCAVWTGSLARPWQITQKQSLAQEPVHSPSPHTEHRVSLSLDTCKLSASHFHSKVKPKHMFNCGSAKSSSICQQRTGARQLATTLSNIIPGSYRTHYAPRQRDKGVCSGFYPPLHPPSSLFLEAYLSVSRPWES